MGVDPLPASPKFQRTEFWGRCLFARSIFPPDFQNSFYLRSLNAGKPFQELFNRGAIFEILEEGGYWNPGATKNPGATYSFRVTLDSITTFPVFRDC